MNKALFSSALAVTLVVAAGAVAVFSHTAPAQAQPANASRLMPLGASGQVAWYVDTDKKLVVMCNAFADNTFECRTKPMP